MSKTNKKVAEEKVEAPVTPAPKTARPKGTVLVKNKTKTYFVQPASGIRIGQGEEKPMLDEGWLQMQIDAGFLELVK